MILGGRRSGSRREFAAARSVQELLIPEHGPETPGFVVESVYVPCEDEVGGDFFQILPRHGDGRDAGDWGCGDKKGIPAER